MAVSYNTLQALQREQNKISIPPKHKFQVFIKPECTCKSQKTHDYITHNCGNVTYIPKYRSSSNIIYLHHKTKFTIGIFNASLGDCNAEIYVDDTYCGLFRVFKNSPSFQLKRPADSDKSFIFVSKNSESAYISGKNTSSNCGVITVIIKPEDKRYMYQPAIHSFSHTKIPPKIQTDAIPVSTQSQIETDFSCSDTIDSPIQSGCTILGSSTNQKFEIASFLPTRGMHVFRYILSVGKPENNSVFFIDNNGQYDNVI